MMVAARVVAAAGHQAEVAGQVLPPVLQVLPAAVFLGAVAALAVEEVLEVGNYIFFNTEANLFISASEL